MSHKSKSEYGTLFVSVVSVRVDTFRGVRFRCFIPFVVSGGKVITLKPINQTICGKSCVKNSFVKIRRRFVPRKNIMIYMYLHARVCECKKYAQKFF